MSHRSTTTEATEPAELQPTVDHSSPTTTMTAAVARRYGTAEVVAIANVPTPQAGKGQVLIQVEASSLNALDWHFLTGTSSRFRWACHSRRPPRRRWPRSRHCRV
ncbi:MAG: hypothetical protein ACR2H3_02135 [Acidimicrobiales bacterium]